MASKYPTPPATPHDRSPRHVIDSTINNIIEQEKIVSLSAGLVFGFIQNLLRCPGSGRLQQLAVAAMFQIIGRDSGRARKFISASPVQPLSVPLIECDDPDRGVSVYCRSSGVITRTAIEPMLARLLTSVERPSHVVWVTADPIDPMVLEYAAGVYERTGGIEFAVLDCLEFVRHFLHLFHRHRTAFLDAYQSLVLREPDSAVSFALKKAFLVLREAASSVPESTA
jgi:hypothetical protein